MNPEIFVRPKGYQISPPRKFAFPADWRRANIGGTVNPPLRLISFH